MNKKQKFSTVLATWPDEKGCRYFGHTDHHGYVDGCDSFWLSFRAVDKADPDCYMTSEARAVSDIGLYVWFSDSGALHVYFAIRDVHSMQLIEAETRLKLLRSFCKKLPDLSRRKAEHFRSMLMDIFSALNITQAIEYRHLVASSKSTFIPVYDAVETIAKEFDRRYNALKGST